MTAKPTVLLVEDEPAVSEPLAQVLAREGYDVTVAADCRAARAAISAAPRLILLDWMLPDGDGLGLLREWRSAGITTPVIFLTARAELIDKVLGLEMGADDYVTKPFEARELIARIRARIRSAPEPEDPSIVVGPLTLDPQARSVSISGTEVRLAKMEFELLQLFMQNPGRVFSRDELLNRVWGYDALPTTRTVDTHVNELRRKLGVDVFESLRGIGYRFKVLESWS